MPTIKFAVNISIDDELIDEPPSELTFSIPVNSAGQPITAATAKNYAKFASEVSKVYQRSLMELLFKRNSTILPGVMQGIYEELTDGNSPTARAVASTPGGTLSGEAEIILRGLLSSSRDFTADIAGTQLGDWNDD
ncbi:MAG: hypothetical protein AAF297_04265 [Planctomycetota bacterium]